MPRQNDTMDEWPQSVLADIVRCNSEVIRSFVHSNYGAIPIDDFSLQIGLPVSTMQKLRQDGVGPKTFMLGRRVYVHKKHAAAWLERMADEQSAA